MRHACARKPALHFSSRTSPHEHRQLFTRCLCSAIILVAAKVYEMEKYEQGTQQAVREKQSFSNEKGSYQSELLIVVSRSTDLALNSLIWGGFKIPVMPITKLLGACWVWETPKLPSGSNISSEPYAPQIILKSPVKGKRKHNPLNFRHKSSGFKSRCEE